MKPKNNKKAHENCTKCFGNLGIDSRMKIYTFLKNSGSSTVSAIVDVVKLTQPTVSYHLKEMRDSGLLLSEKKGKEVYYAISGACPTNSGACVLTKVDFSKRSKNA